MLITTMTIQIYTLHIRTKPHTHTHILMLPLSLPVYDDKNAPQPWPSHPGRLFQCYHSGQVLTAEHTIYSTKVLMVEVQWQCKHCASTSSLWRLNAASDLREGERIKKDFKKIVQLSLDLLYCEYSSKKLCVESA